MIPVSHSLAFLLGVAEYIGIQLNSKDFSFSEAEALRMKFLFPCSDNRLYGDNTGGNNDLLYQDT